METWAGGTHRLGVANLVDKKKGIISSIVPDSQMAVDAYGNRADVIAMETSAFNRMDSCLHMATCVE